MRRRPVHKWGIWERRGPANFRELNDAELYELSDDELVAYIVRARAAGRTRAAEVGVQILAYKHERQVTGFVFNQLGSKGAEVVDQVAARTIADAIAAAASFEGETIEEFRGFLFRIARRRRVDYLRKNRVDEVPLVNERDEDAREREFSEGDPLEAVDRASVFNQAFRELQRDDHKLVVLLTIRPRARGQPRLRILEPLNQPALKKADRDANKPVADPYLDHPVWGVAAKRRVVVSEQSRRDYFGPQEFDALGREALLDEAARPAVCGRGKVGVFLQPDQPPIGVHPGPRSLDPELDDELSALGSARRRSSGGRPVNPL